MLRVALGRDADNATSSTERRNNVKIAILVERHALGPAQATIKDMHLATLRDAVHAVVAGCGRAGDVEFPTWMKRKMICGHRRFQRGEDENFALRTNLENGPAAVSHKKISVLIERQAGGNAHPLDPLFRLAVRSDAVNGAVMTTGDKQAAVVA